MRLLLVEDEIELASIILSYCRKRSFDIDHVSQLDDARAAIEITAYQLIILDRRLPDGEGLDLVPRAKRLRPATQIIALTALDKTTDKIVGLDRGADDYLAKPFDMDELMARIRAALRRLDLQDQPPVQCGKLSFNPITKEVRVSGLTLPLSRRELSLVECLALRAGRVVLRETLLSQVYGLDDEIQSNALDSHVSRLRSKLWECDAGVGIFPVRGVGYLMDELTRRP